MTMKGFKKLFETYKRAEIAASEIENRWESDPENKDLEAAFDVAYELEHKALDNLIDGIVTYTAGLIDRRTAYLMIMKKPEELENIVARIA